ncbi:tetratricopeptide repeat protein [Kaistella sp.]|uniref:tetratricopeptide repeat protein n=1 Tax=Kaistella sp. TaxID=2782235 RepID=UPI002F95E9AD
MNLPHEKENRDVIPNWRSFKITSDLGELSKFSYKPDLIFDLEALKLDWKNNKTIGVAADLLNAYFISNKKLDSVIIEASEFITFSSKPPKLLHQLSSRINSKSREIVHDTQIIFEGKKNDLISKIRFLIENTARRQISFYKELVKNDPRNPINWVELSRLYSIEGNKIKSEKCIINALHLAPNNRYVLRCATRLFIENEKPEMAIYYLRKSSQVAVDPWITSAHIAVSSYLEKYSPFIKNAFKQRESNKFTNFDLTELNSSLGTLELSNGTFKKARSLFNDSLKLPNDNSLAQFQFVLNQDKRLSSVVNSNSYNVKNNFEALALKYRDEGEWDKSLDNALQWFLDVPYSADPAVFSSYILCTVFGDYDTAVEVCLLALRINPSDPTLTNNLVYSLLNLNRISEAEKYLAQLNHTLKESVDSINIESKITAIATNALYLIKINNIEEGLNLYKEAITLAKKTKMNYCVLSAKLNMAKELKNTTSPIFNEMEKEILKLNLSDYKDLSEFRKRNFPSKISIN